MTKTEFYSCCYFIYWGDNGVTNYEKRNRVKGFICSCLSMSTYSDIRGNSMSEKTDYVIEVIRNNKYECLVRERE